MPSQNVDNTVVTYTGLVANQNYTYNLTRTPSTNSAHGASIQAVYSGSSPTFVIALAASNDGINFAPISGTSVSVSAAGTTVWDLGTPNYKFVQVQETYTSGTINLTLIFNANNLS
jgi:hypothetical protein